jgi:two-component system, OmpR family, response regulator MprA
MTQLLIVEDEAEIAGYLRRGLTFEGFSVEVAPDGPSAIAAARERPPSLVVLDLMLPGMDGLEVARRIRAAAIAEGPSGATSTLKPSKVRPRRR